MADAPSSLESPRPLRRRFFLPGGLSARLLVLTVLFVAFGGALALPPAPAAFTQQWLLERVRAAELVSLASDISPEGFSKQDGDSLLQGAGLERVAIDRKSTRLNSSHTDISRMPSS